MSTGSLRWRGLFLAALTVIFYLSSIYIPILVFVEFSWPSSGYVFDHSLGHESGVIGSFGGQLYSFCLCWNSVCHNLFVDFSFGLDYGLTIKRGYTLWRL
jgi:hypothetical protein